MITTGTLLLADVDWDGHMDLDGGWWIVMVVAMILFWGLVLAGIAWLVRELGSSREQGHRAAPPAADPGSEALRILDRRLAAGEISTSEYRERRATLRDDLQSSSDAT